MRILVSGATGFLGLNLRKELKRRQLLDVCHFGSAHEISNYDIMKDLFKVVDPDVVFHLAAIPTVRADSTDPSRIIDVNVKGTNNILANMRPNSRIVFASSIVVYGTCDKAMRECDPVNCTSVYAATKVACEELIKSYHVTKNIQYTNCRLGAMVGPHLTHGLLKDVIRKIESDSPELELFGAHPGSAKPYTHVVDVVQKMVESLNNPFYKNKTMNICNNDCITVEEVAKVAMDTLGIQKPIKWLGEGANWKGDNRKLLVDNILSLGVSRTSYISSKNAVAEAIHDIKRDQ